ncbi:MAG: glycosyltransferase [Gammaproteobacteria bacterium]|nr:glycosyltransferase [Gammaproteobacteria bacterium]
MHHLCLIPFERWNTGLIALLALMIPLSTAGTNSVLVLWIGSWMIGHVLHGDLRVQISQMLSEPVTRALLLFVGMFVVASFYSTAPWSDIRISLGKMSKWLYLPFLVCALQPSRHRRWVLNAFLSSMMLTLFLAILKIYGGISLWSVRFTDACVFKDHIFTNLMMSFAAFLLAHKALQSAHTWKRVGFLLLCTASIYYVLFMSEGRSGYVILALLWVFFFIQMQQGKYRAVGITSLIVLLIVAGLYFSTFQRRILQVIHTVPLINATHAEGDISIRQRLVYMENTAALIKIHPWVGFGTGSFKTVYEKYALNRIWPMTANPHNEYLNITLQCGVLGLAALLWFFYVLHKSIQALERPEKYYAEGLLGIMVVGCLGNAWFMDFTSGYFFMVCLAACLATAPLPSYGRGRSQCRPLKPSKISVIVTSYNWPLALSVVLRALVAQKTSCDFEVIIADDGSTAETAACIALFKQQTALSITHVWQPDQGFRVTAIRNKAINKATGDYIIFVDGDCIPRENFIQRHYLLAETKTFVAGNRILLRKAFTQHALNQAVALHQWSIWDWCKARVQGYCNRVLPLLSLPAWAHFKSARRWKGAKGCNLAVWKADLCTVNGWEETFVGWGYEDSDLVARLLKCGLKNKSGRFYVPVIHLWHPENDRTREQTNWAQFKDRQKKGLVCSVQGLSQYTG